MPVCVCVYACIFVCVVLTMIAAPVLTSGMTNEPKNPEKVVVIPPACPVEQSGLSHTQMLITFPPVLGEGMGEGPKTD